MQSKSNFKSKKRKNYTSDHRFWGSLVFFNTVKKVQSNNTIDPSIFEMLKQTREFVKFIYKKWQRLFSSPFFYATKTSKPINNNKLYSVIYLPFSLSR